MIADALWAVVVILIVEWIGSPIRDIVVALRCPPRSEIPEADETLKAKQKGGRS
jgi:hypothetical protein